MFKNKTCDHTVHWWETENVNMTLPGDGLVRTYYEGFCIYCRCYVKLTELVSAPHLAAILLKKANQSVSNKK